MKWFDGMLGSSFILIGGFVLTGYGACHVGGA